MAKKVVGKSDGYDSSKSNSQGDSKIDDTLVENFVSLQRVMTNLSVSLDNLSNRMSRLLDLFESSAKSLAEKDIEAERRNGDIMRKLDSLSEHNKVFAQGLTLLHEKVSPEMSSNYEETKPLPRMPVQTMQKKMDGDGYQRSISSQKP